MTDNIKPETIKKTQDYLGKYIKKPPLTEKLLKKPPFRFLHDIITNVIKETGFLNGVFTSEELNHENIKDRDGKIVFLQKAIDAVKTITGISLTVRPSKIVAGHEPTKTNELLQAIGKALDKKLDSNDYVANLGKPDRVEKEGRSKATNKEEERAKTKGRDRSRSKGRPPPGTATKEKEATSGSRSKRSKTKDPSSSRRISSETDVTQAETRADDDALVSVSAPDVIPAPLDDLPSAPVNVTPEELDLSAVASEAPDGAASGDAGTPVAQTATEEPAEEETTPATVAADIAPRQSPDVPPQADSPFPVTRSNSPTKKVPGHEKKRKQSKSNVEPVRAVRATPTSEKDDSVAVLAAKTPSTATAPPSARAPVAGSRAPPSGVAPGARPVAAPPSARPRTARPASARPAAPRVRERGIAPTVTEDSSSRVQTGKVDVITDDVEKDQDEVENFVVVESPLVTTLEEEGPAGGSPAMGGDGPRSVDSVAEGAQGHLVAQILETQRELEEKARQLEGQGTRQTHVDIEWGEGRRREREAAGREVERLRSSIQTLTRAANPLGKLMDFLQEDADAMQRELDTWRASNQQLTQQLAMEQRRTEEALEPLRLRLGELERAVDARRDEISALKANVLRNDTRLRRLVAPTVPDYSISLQNNNS